MQMRYSVIAWMVVTVIALSTAIAGAKPRFVSGDNYNASQFSAPGLAPTFGETMKMLIGHNVDKHSAKPEHGAEHGEDAGQVLLQSYDQKQCSSFCRTVPGGLDPENNEAYEACLGPCFECARISISAQAGVGTVDVGPAAFDACYHK